MRTYSREKESPPGAFRIVNGEEGYQLTLDEAKEGDQVFEHEGENCLLLDTEVGEAVQGGPVDTRPAQAHNPCSAH